MAEHADVAKTTAAYDIVAESYATLVPQLFAENPVDRAVITAFAEMVSAGDSTAVADIGCGPGHITDHLVRLGLDAFGVDVSTAMIDVARRTYPHLRFDIGSMDQLDVPSASLAGVVAWYSIIHVPPDRHHLVFAEFARVLRPGGHLLVAFQMGDEPRHIEHAYGHDIDLDAFRLPLESTSARLETAGFTAVAHLVRAPLAQERTPQGFILATSAALAPRPFSGQSAPVRIVHKVAIPRPAVDETGLNLAGLESGPAGLPMLFLDVGEDDDRWPQIQTLISRAGGNDFVYTEFDDDEIASASWLRLNPDGPYTCPAATNEPTSSGEATYDFTDYCAQCGIGVRQVAPFRLDAEPSWDGNAVRQYGHFGEVFATPEVYAGCFQPFGVASRPVRGPGRTPLETIVQIVADEHVEMLADPAAAETCQSCRRVKFHPHTRGPLPALASASRTAAARTAQWFGGASFAKQFILVSQPIAAALKTFMVQGVALHPVAQSPSRSSGDDDDRVAVGEEVPDHL